MIVKLNAQEMHTLAMIGFRYVLQGNLKTLDLLDPTPTRKIKNLKKIKKVAAKMKRKPMSQKRRKEIGRQMKAYWAKRRAS